VSAALDSRVGGGSVVRVGVVLAAGRSERLNGVLNGGSKALLSLGGVSLVERAVRTLHDAGVERVAVVAGYEIDSLATSLNGSDVEIVRADEWELGNGASMAAAVDLVGDEERFAAMCGDDVFAAGALDDLVRSAAPAVLVDSSPDPAVWAEGTRVRIDDGKATAFGKALDEPAVDCGVFLFPTAIFGAYREAAATDDYSLAGAATMLARDVPMRVVPLRSGLWWQDVDTPEDVRTARTLIRRSLGKETDGLVSRRLNRPISTRITMALAPLHMSPTLFSVVALLVGLWAAWSLSAGRALLGALLIQSASILDGSDGETARLQGNATHRGAALDAFFDRMVDAAIYSGLWLWALDNPSPGFRIAVTFVSAVGWGLLATSLKEPVAVFELPRREEPRLVAHFGGRDGRMLILAIGSLAGLPLLALVAGVLSFVGSALWRVVFVVSSRHRGAHGQGRLATAGPAAANAVAAKTSRGAAGAAMADASLAGTPDRSALAALARIARILLFPTVIVVVFLVVLPRLVDLDRVWALIRVLSFEAQLVLFALAVLNLVTYWPVIMVSMPGLSLKQAAVACQTSTTVAMTVPAGGAVAVGVSYAMYSSWGFGPAAIASSALATFVAGMSVKLVLPLVALLILVAEGEQLSGLTSVALTGTVATTVGVVLLWLVLGADKSARRIGRAAESGLNMLRESVGRSPITGLEDRILGFRSRLGGLLRDRWRLLTVTATISQLSVFSVMLATMHLAGISQNEVGWAQALAVFASIRLATSVPIVPGNVGFAELGYIGGLVLAGADTTEAVAAVLLFRFLTYFIQIPIGGATFWAWRRQHSTTAADSTTA